MDNCDRCSHRSQDDGTSIHSKSSGGCLNCLQRQDSRRQERKNNGTTYYPCSVSYDNAETLPREQRMSMTDGTVRAQHHRNDQNPPPCPSLPYCRSSGSLKSFPGYTSRPKQTNTGVWKSSKSLDQMERHDDRYMGESYDGVRLVPLTQQTALQSSGSLQLVAALSPGIILTLLLSLSFNIYMCVCYIFTYLLVICNNHN